MSLAYSLSSDLPRLLKRPHLTLAHWTQVSDRCGLLVLYSISQNVMTYKCVCMCVCVYSGLTSLSTIFQSYHDGVWLRQGAQCSLLLCCLTEVSCPRHLT